MIFFTICSNNYLAQATILGESLKKFHPESFFYIVLADKLQAATDYKKVDFEIIPIETIEPAIDELALRYNIVELNTSVKPGVFEFLFSRPGSQKVIYLDPDTKLFAPMSALETVMDTANIVLTPHIESPIPLDGKSPGENSFLNFGIYNLGFLALSKSAETDRFIAWWKERTYKYGYIKPEDGFFVDQLYINFAPLFFTGVHILKHKGYNMAPWNFHERILSVQNGHIMVNNTDELVFFHFSSFRVDSGELPTFYYDRFSMKDRPDLYEIYKVYNDELKAYGHFVYKGIECYYTTVYLDKKISDERERVRRLSLLKRMSYSVMRAIPAPARKRISKFLLN